MGIFGFIKRLAVAIWRGLDTLRRILHFILLLGLFGILLAVAGGGQPPLAIPGRAALVINPTGQLVEQLSGSPLDRAFAEVEGSEPVETLLADVTASIEAAAGDERIDAIVLQLDGLAGGGLPKLQAIGAALDEFRASGKKVVAVGGGYSRDQYYLAAHADEVIMHPLGLLLVEGYEYYKTYFRDGLDKLKVDVNVFKVGQYKSFVEPFTRDDMSPEDREASQRWVTALWSAWQRDVAAAREVEPAVLADYANRLPQLLEAAGGNAGKAALTAGLVDQLLTPTAVDAYLIDLVGESDAGDGSFSAVDLRSYARALRLDPRQRLPKSSNVAVVVASGEIVDGKAGPGTVGGDTLAAELRSVRTDDSVSAVVLRIDSPGGSMFASDIILDEVQALKAAGKPVVASMSSVAASGGYYIAMEADAIVASDATITGSIGVGALVPTVQRGLDALGVHVDGFGTTTLAGQLRLDRPLGPEARRILTGSVEDAYRIFVGKVASSRKLAPEKADGLAQGRVWIGADAKDLGLVDELGGLDDAVALAADRAGLVADEYGVTWVQPELSLIERVLLQGAEVAVRITRAVGLRPGTVGFLPPPLADRISELAAEARALAAWNDPRGIYAHCLCTIR
jgi:protease IV